MQISWVFVNGEKKVIFVYRFQRLKQSFPVDPSLLIQAIGEKRLADFIRSCGSSRPDTDYLASQIVLFNLSRSQVYRLLGQKNPHPITLSYRSPNWGGFRVAGGFSPSKAQKDLFDAEERRLVRLAHDENDLNYFWQYQELYLSTFHVSRPPRSLASHFADMVSDFGR